MNVAIAKVIVVITVPAMEWWERPEPDVGLATLSESGFCDPESVPSGKVVGVVGSCSFTVVVSASVGKANVF